MLGFRPLVLGNEQVTSMFCKLGIVRFKINEAIKSQRNKEKSFVGNMEKVNLKFYIIYIYSQMN